MKPELTKTNGSSPPPEHITQPRVVHEDVHDLEEVWTVAATADYLKMRPRQVWELTRRRSQERSRHPLPFIKVHSKCLRFRKTDVQQWLEALAQKVSTR